MGKKNKRGRGRNRSAVDHLKIARRELEKRNAKLALEHARSHHQASPDPEASELVARALLARAEQLFERGNRQQAGGLLDELRSLELPVNPLSPQIEMLAVRLGEPPVGVSEGAAPEEVLSDEVVQSLADEAVLHPHRRSPAYPQWNQQADWIREALQQVEAGQPEAAAERLASIPRKSPLSDWRLFVRGLAAHYAGDASRRAANWDRLSPERAANRIANHLLVFGGLRQPAEVDFDTSSGQRRLRKALAGNSLISQLETMRDHFQAGRIEPMLKILRGIRQRHARSHPELIERVTDLLWKHYVRQGDSRALFRLKRSLPGPPLDPHWYRATGLFVEQMDEQDLNRTESVWFGYLKDLATCAGLRDEERGMAAGLVYQRLADDFLAAVRNAKTERSMIPFFARPKDTSREDEESAVLADRAEYHLRQALSRCPQLLAVHRKLVELLRERERMAEAVQAAMDLLQHFPEDFDTLVWLGNYHIEADQPVQAEPYIERASHLRPRDDAIQALMWNQNLGLFRQRVRKRKFDEARCQLQELAALERGAFRRGPAPYIFPLLEATIEYKAKNDKAAEALLETARKELDEPTPLWLVMHTYSEQFALRRPLKNEFRDRFKAAIKGRVHSRTASRLAVFLTGYLVRRVKYVGLATHQRLLIDYLQRAKRVTWNQADLHDVCRFLLESTERRAVEVQYRLAETGCRQFPAAPLFWYLMGKGLTRRSPSAFGFTPHLGPSRDIEYLEKALELNKQAEFPLRDSERADAENTLHSARATREMLAAFFGLSGLMNALGEDGDEDWDDEEDDWDDDEDWVEDADDVDTWSDPGPRRKRSASTAASDQQGFLF